MASPQSPRSERAVAMRKTKPMPGSTLSKKPSTNRSESVSKVRSRIGETDICQETHESLLLLWFDPHDQSTLNLVGPLRAINDHVQACVDSASCFSAIRSSEETIFFITSSSDAELISKIHQSAKVEAIFILDPNTDGIRGDWPKVCGVFKQQEELFRVLKDILDIYEQVYLEIFSFENDKLFLWSQLFREDLLSRSNPLKKTIFLEAVRKYYQDNLRIVSLIEEFEKVYRPTDILSWCLRSPFPSRFLHHALRSHHKEGLRLCQSLLIDAVRRFQQQPARKTTDQFYRGMKLTNELLEQFESHVGQLVSTSAFFPCTKSRTNALTLASMANYRPDLYPVLFKVDCDGATQYIEIPNKNAPSTIVFDLCTAFRIVYVNRGGMSVIKLKTATEAGKKIALNYLEQNKDKTIPTLMAELLIPPKPPTPPPPPPPPVVRAPTPPPAPVSSEEPKPCNDELKAKEYLDRGDIDRAIIAYQRIRPMKARILNIIGHLCSEKKGDYTYALRCHTQALKMQEESGQDVAETLTKLGDIHFHLKDYDAALSCHTRALALHCSPEKADQVASACNLISLAKIHRARSEHTQALEYSKQALSIREKLDPVDPISVASALAMIGDIYVDTNEYKLALEYCAKALPLFEGNLPEDSQLFLDLLYNLARVQFRAGQFDEAHKSFERVLQIYRKTLPRGHPSIVAVEDDLRNVVEIAEEHKKEKEKLAKRMSKEKKSE